MRKPSTLRSPKQAKGEWATRAHKINRKVKQRAGVRDMRSYAAPMPWSKEEIDYEEEDSSDQKKKQQQNQSPAAQKKQAIESVDKTLREQREDMGLVPTTWISATGTNQRKIWTTLFTPDRSKSLDYWFNEYWFKIANRVLLMHNRYELFGPQIPFFYTANRRAADKATRYDKKELQQIALDMHEKIYKAFAEARITDIESMCLEGLAESMRHRMSRRARDDMLQWSRSPDTQAKLVSWKQVPTMLKYKDKPIYTQQATVRISGAQTLRRGRRMGGKWTEEQLAAGEDIIWMDDGAASASSDVDARSAGTVKKDAVEYLVLQRRLLALEPTKWAVWGFAEETTLENYEATALKDQNLDRKVNNSIGNGGSGQDMSPAA